MRSFSVTNVVNAIKFGIYLPNYFTHNKYISNDKWHLQLSRKSRNLVLDLGTACHNTICCSCRVSNSRVHQSMACLTTFCFCSRFCLWLFCSRRCFFSFFGGVVSALGHIVWLWLWPLKCAHFDKSVSLLGPSKRQPKQPVDLRLSIVDLTSLSCHLRISNFDFLLLMGDTKRGLTWAG